MPDVCIPQRPNYDIRRSEPPPPQQTDSINQEIRCEASLVLPGYRLYLPPSLARIFPNPEISSRACLAFQYYSPKEGSREVYQARY